ncbi:cilia- and flagella-associated protein 157 [Spodoptera frugiperda]|uniref:Cilia- and flagella-associated protein 157 n=1 Tax=Spodoptera frugiperda TaxID=7108 RepID=A0A9R0EQ68_SPOFR|nr:cilia- and flagella-associated protein 157 [Spodoptera frugiperda]
MAPKKDKGKKDDEKAGAFNEVERTFLELQLSDCNRKVARLRSAVEEYEQRLEELQKAYDKLDEDRADIIAYLKKTLTIKNEENVELKEKVKGLEEIREIENERFQETTRQLEKDFVIMKEQLTSENKLLAGKLNTLEEFRAIRDDLMRKFENQEQEFKDQEMKYKRIIYDTEKKFVIGKDNLKKEMEARLLQLAQDFQDATELRVAASTHRVIRENIAINNELENILASQAKLVEQNDSFRDSMRAAIVSKELAEEERDKAIGKSVVQLKVIEQLTAAFESVKKEKSLFEKRSYDFEAQRMKIERLTKENDNLSLQVRVLEQNLHARMSDQNKAVVESVKMSKEREKLRKILKEAAVAIQASLKLDEWATVNAAREVMDRRVLLSHLLEIVSQYRELEHAESVGTIGSFSKIYEEGDLGFVPRPKKKQALSEQYIVDSAIPTKDTSEVEVETLALASHTTTSITTSVDTVPSIHIIPSKKDLGSKDEGSAESFVASSVSEEVVEEEEKQKEDDIEKQLEESKVAMQKSFLKDFALSQASLKRQSEIKVDIKRMSKVVSTLRLPLEEKDDMTEKSLADEVEIEKSSAEVDDTAPSPAAAGDAGTDDDKEIKTPIAEQQSVDIGQSVDIEQPIDIPQPEQDEPKQTEQEPEPKEGAD